MLLLEIQKWPAELRQVRKTAHANVKERKEPVGKTVHRMISVRNRDFKPGVQQIWWDLCANRSFTLIYDYPGIDTTLGLYKRYSQLLNICDSVELFNLIEGEDAFELAGQAGGYSPPSTLPRIQMEIATWLPNRRDEMIKFTEELVKEESKRGPFPVAGDVMSVHNPEFEPGSQVWWDLCANRSFCLIYDWPLVKSYDIWVSAGSKVLKRRDAEHINLIELSDVLKYKDVETPNTWAPDTWAHGGSK